MSTIEEIEARRAARKAALANDRAQQFVQDMEALDALEEEHGDGSVERLKLDRYVKGYPTFVVLKAPTAAQYKRMNDQVARAAQRNDPAERVKAQNLLAESVWVYPAEAEKRKAMLDVFPGLLNSIVIRAVRLVEANLEEEGKD